MEDASTDEAGRAASEIMMNAAKSDLQKAVRYARNDGERLDAALEYTLVAREWRRLPELYRSALQSEECISPSWWGGLGPFIEPLQDTIALWERSRACDPLNFYPWTNSSGLQSTQGNFEAAIATATEGLKRVQHRQVADAMITGYIGAGQYDAALAANERLIDNPAARSVRRLEIAAARGDAERAHELYRELVKDRGGETLGVDTVAMIGNREMANKLAAAADARPLGFLDLLDAADSCKCGAPFDLEFTPNFARLIDEAQLVWPPRRPIEWPLKDW
jgi:tetratricopeptide (TPR) repeat protein